MRGLQKTEIGEVEEGFAKGQKGSSAMPHKRNPIGCEQLTGLARLLRANAMAALENVALWHERDISHSSVERIVIPDSFIVLDHMLRRFTRIVRGLVVHPERMRENLERSRGIVFSGTVLLELAQRGVSREQAYAWVQRAAMRSHDERLDFKTLLAEDPEVMAVLSRTDLDQAFDLERQLRHAGPIVDRVLAGVASGSSAAAWTLRGGARRENESVRHPEAVGVRPAGPRRLSAMRCRSMGYGSVRDVRQGKYFELEVDAETGPQAARSLVTEVADRLLANPVIESYRVEVDGDGPPAPPGEPGQRRVRVE